MASVLNREHEVVLVAPSLRAAAACRLIRVRAFGTRNARPQSPCACRAARLAATCAAARALGPGRPKRSARRPHPRRRRRVVLASASCDRTQLNTLMLYSKSFYKYMFVQY